ncbi:hypothetical protein SLS53_006226 [Cytospora paraplurivora]|uniref:Major facilitator superfamily (MFS) profile domain-containing protein n=1 Tax=Cytospora paraplurivora TaxID=2898453 RepID=A0AAN9U5K2_9PEZI
MAQPVDDTATAAAESGGAEVQGATIPPAQPTLGLSHEKGADSEPITLGENTKYGWLFWLVFAALGLSTLLAGLEASVVSTALPTILGDLGAGDDYVWVINIYFLTTSAASQPLYGQLSDLWGRRWVMIMAVTIFTGANAICGAATTTSMLIVGRGVQGIGCGGINTLVDIIICDLVPLRDRGSKVGLLFAVMTVSGTLGPLIGGALAQAGAWRWIVYMNLPLGGLALTMLVLFLRVSRRPSLSARAQLRQIDFVGNLSSPQILATFVVGLALLLMFPITQRLPHLCPNPVVPPRILKNRTSALALFISFNHCLLIFWVTYFFPVCFQSVLLSTPTRSGIQLLPLVCLFSFSAAILGAAMSRWGRYRPLLWVGLALLTVGLGCCSLLGRAQSEATWIGLEVVVALGLGIVMPALLPAVQVGLSDADTAVSTRTWAFLRSYGSIRGVSIPAAVLNNLFAQKLGQVDDLALRGILAGQGAYTHASRSFLLSLSHESREQVMPIYEASLRRVWQVAVVFGGVPFLAVFAMQSIDMRTELKTEFG